MNSIQRFLSASAASWLKILLTVASQLLLVPIILSHWSVEQFGCWLIIQTIVGISSIVSAGHQIFIGYEFLRVGDKRPQEMRTLFYSSLPWVFLISLFELLILCGLVYWGFIDTVFDARTMDKGLLHQALLSLILYSVSYLVASTAGGLAGRLVYPYGDYPRMTWWTTLLAIVMALTQAVAVVLGADLLQTVVWVIVSGLVVNIPIHLDLWRLLRSYGLYPVAPNWRLGLRNFRHSLAISLGTVLDNLRQQGVRIFLGALVGVAEMTAFSTMRTMSNLSLQGIGTITNPIMPEIMRFLRERDSQRTNATVGFVWFFAVILLSPTLIAFQWIMPFVFHAWTRGKIAFNPALFGLFSLTLLVFSVARPSAAVLQGNNLLRLQLVISVIVSIVAITGIFLLTPALGISGAAASLLLAELVGTVLSVWFAWRWLDDNGITFPWRLFGVAVGSITVAAAAIFAIVRWPQIMPAVIGAALIANCAIAVAFFRQLPPVAVNKMRGLMFRFH